VAGPAGETAMKLRFSILLALSLPVLTAAAPPPDLGDFAYRQRLGNQLPLDTEFRDETGRGAALRNFLGGKPAVLALVYFHCPNLCGIVRTDLFDALARSGMIAGRDYTLIALSIDPSETVADAQEAKTDDLSRYPLPGGQQASHFLTGSAGSVQAVADAVGFRDRFDPDLKQFLHPAGIVFTTASGVVSSYLLGVGYEPGDVRLGVTRANLGSIAAAALPVLLLCFHYDPQTGRYTLAIMKLLRLAGLITVVTIAGTLFLAFRREKGRA
jgi:protein SCO1/2